MSRRLGDEQRRAYGRFWREAQRLATISHSFDQLARSSTAAYFQALKKPARRTWTTFVTRTALLVHQARAIDGIIVLCPAERAALDFLTEIVLENADLLEPSVAVTPPEEPRMLVSV